MQDEARALREALEDAQRKVTLLNEQVALVEQLKRHTQEQDALVARLQQQVAQNRAAKQVRGRGQGGTSCWNPMHRSSCMAACAHVCMLGMAAAADAGISQAGSPPWPCVLASQCS